MILADKIINERKKCGWSQEELAEKLSVSRQSVSKWEGAQSVPDLNKIIAMAEIFGVTTDYLLKDDMEPSDLSNNKVAVDCETIPARRKVTMEEAREYMSLKKDSSIFSAIGTVLCILSPALLIGLYGLNAFNPSIISEEVASITGLVVLLIMVYAAIFLFVCFGSKAKKYAFLHIEDFETEYGVEGMLKEKKAQFESEKNIRTALGIMAIILGVLPLLICGFMNVNDAYSFWCTDLLLVVVAAAVFNFIQLGSVSGPVEVLLQEGDFSRNAKKNTKKLSPLTTALWCLAIAVFLGYSFITGDWERSWIVWPVTGVLHVVVASIAKMAMKLED